MSLQSDGIEKTLEEKVKVDEGSESKYSAGGMFYAFFMDIPGLFQTFSYGGSF